jgi:hypothetical protein
VLKKNIPEEVSLASSGDIETISGQEIVFEKRVK